MVSRKSLTPVRQQPEAARLVAHSTQVRGTGIPSVTVLPHIAVGTAAPSGDSPSPSLPPTVAEAFQGLSETVRTQLAAGGLLASDGLPEVIETDEPAHGTSTNSNAHQDSWSNSLEEIDRLQAEAAARDAQRAELESLIASLQSELETFEEQLEVARQTADHHASQHEHCALQLTELQSTNSTLAADLTARQADVESLSKSQYDAMRQATRSDEQRLAAETREKQASARLSRTTADLTAVRKELASAQLLAQHLEKELSTSITSAGGDGAHHRARSGAARVGAGSGRTRRPHRPTRRRHRRDYHPSPPRLHHVSSG